MSAPPWSTNRVSFTVLIAGLAVLMDWNELHALDIPVEVMELQVKDDQVGQVNIHISNIKYLENGTIYKNPLKIYHI